MAQRPRRSVPAFFQRLSHAFSSFAGRAARGFYREFAGESNRLTTIDRLEPMAGMVVNLPNPDDRLEFEKSRVKIKGSPADVHRVRCLDQVIGELSASFNARASQKIALHVNDLAGALARIKAYKIETDGRETPVDRLEYKTTTITLG